MFRRFLVAAVVVLALASSATAVPAVAKTNKAVSTHKLIVTVKKNVALAAEKKLAILVLINQRPCSCRSRGHAAQAPYCSPRQ